MLFVAVYHNGSLTVFLSFCCSIFWCLFIIGWLYARLFVSPANNSSNRSSGMYNFNRHNNFEWSYKSTFFFCSCFQATKLAITLNLIVWQWFMKISYFFFWFFPGAKINWFTLWFRVQSTLLWWFLKWKEVVQLITIQ